MKVTIGSIFCRLAHCILSLKLFDFLFDVLLITNNWIFVILLILGLLFMAVFFIVNLITMGYGIETYLKNNNILKDKKESEENII